MTFDGLFNSLLSDTGESLRAFGPELALSVTVVVMLLLRVLTPNRLERLTLWVTAWLPLVGASVGLYLAAPWLHLGEGASSAEAGREIFTGLLLYDPLTVFFRAFLMLFVFLFVVFTQISGVPNRDDATDFYALVLGATVGMCLMASANHLLIVFLAVEMASVPSYALSGIMKGRKRASEAAIKYAVYGAGAAGVMLYGISLLAGVTGSAHLPTMARQLALLLETGQAPTMVLVLGGLMVMAGLAFKLSAVPFHFWCPDVFEGATAEVNAFLSVASKGAALALLVRVALGLGYVAPLPVPEEQPVAHVALVGSTAEVADERFAEAAGRSATAARVAPRFASQEVSAAPIAADDTEAMIRQLAPVRTFMVWIIAGVAAVTCTFGNLAAYGQTNIKRLLAYSTIAHAGYMMMPVAAAVALIDRDTVEAGRAIGFLAFYIGCYLFMNLGAFAIVAFLRNAMRSEEIADYAGLIRNCPFVAISMMIILLSLIGIPPMAGFVAKLSIFYTLVPAELWWLLAIGGLNTVLSLFYYLRVIKLMIVDPEPETRLPFSLPVTSFAGVYVGLVTAPVVILGIWGDDLFRWTGAAARNLLP